MHKDNPDNSTADDEQLVGDAYRSVATEAAPPDLDRRILGDATRSVRQQKPGRSSASWERPLAFAATVALSLALLFELTDRDSPDLPRSAPTEPAVPAGTAAPADEATPTHDAFAGEADAAARRIEELEDTVGAALQRSPDEERFDADMNAPTGPFCDEAATSEPERWRDCIDALIKAQRTHAAEAELARLRQAFPDFEPPR